MATGVVDPGPPLAVAAIVVRIEGKITQERRCPGALWEVHKVTERFAPGESFIQIDKGSPLQPAL